MLREFLYWRDYWNPCFSERFTRCINVNVWRGLQVSGCTRLSVLLWFEASLFVFIDSSHVITSNFCSEGAFQQLSPLVRNGRGSTLGVRPKWVGSLSSHPPGPSRHPWDFCSILLFPAYPGFLTHFVRDRRERWGDQTGLDLVKELTLGLVLILVPWWLVLFGNRRIHLLVMLRIEINNW